MPNTEIKPKICFFSEQGAVTQSPTQAFGPIAGNEQNEFRLTAKFSCTDKKAYSICKGVVLIVPQAGSTDKVNILLRPYNQPYFGVNIKYFVYRGLRKADFFTTASDPLVIPKVNNVTNQLVNKVNEDFDDFYSTTLKDVNGNVIPKPAFLAKFIGYDTNAASSKLISDYFFKESVITNGTENDAFELPLIDGGKWIGNFDGECGIDVVINYGDYKQAFDNGEFVFDLGYAKAAEAKITLAGTDYEKKLLKEQTVQFLDAAAYFGLFAENGKVEIFNGGTVTPKEGINIYNDVLSGFHTRNNWYIYIQSDRGRSYGFYGNYQIADGNPNQLKIGNTENSLTETVYGYYGWPMLVNTQQQQSAQPRNKVYLQMVTDNNINTVLYCNIGTLENHQSGKFKHENSILTTPNGQGNYDVFTQVIQLSISASSDGKNVPSITQLCYKGVKVLYATEQTVDVNGQPVNLYSNPDWFEDVFDLLKAKPTLLEGNATDFMKTVSLRENLINHYKDGRIFCITAAQTAKVNDTIVSDSLPQSQIRRITYISEIINLTNSFSLLEPTTSVDMTSSAASDAVSSAYYQLPYPYFYVVSNFTPGTEVIKSLRLRSITNAIPSKLIIGITEQENDLLEDLIGSSIKNPRILLDPIHDGNLVAKEGTIYQMFKLCILAEQSGALQLLHPDEDVLVYTMDWNIFFSSDYSMYEKNRVAQNYIIQKEL